MIFKMKVQDIGSVNPFNYKIHSSLNNSKLKMISYQDISDLTHISMVNQALQTYSM